MKFEAIIGIQKYLKYRNIMITFEFSFTIKNFFDEKNFFTDFNFKSLFWSFSN